MHGLVSLLDDEHFRLVEEIWDELERDFGVRNLYVTPFPHFSYQVAETYDMELAAGVLSEVARTTAPFTVRTTGLGIFNITHPVLYVPVVRSPELSDLHEMLWREVTRAATGATEYYRPEMWMPHITLAHGDIDIDRLTAAVRGLSARNFHWEIRIDNLTVIYDTGTEQGLRHRFGLGDHGHITSDYVI